jgi:hypothetical protein
MELQSRSRKTSMKIHEKKFMIVLKLLTAGPDRSSTLLLTASPQWNYSQGLGKISWLFMELRSEAGRVSWFRYEGFRWLDAIGGSSAFNMSVQIFENFMIIHETPVQIWKFPDYPWNSSPDLKISWLSMKLQSRFENFMIIHETPVQIWKFPDMHDEVDNKS